MPFEGMLTYKHGVDLDMSEDGWMCRMCIGKRLVAKFVEVSSFHGLSAYSLISYD